MAVADDHSKERARENKRSEDETRQQSAEAKSTGYWAVEPRTGEDTQPDIFFRVLTAGCPAEQQRLKNEIERALSALRVIYAESSSGKFNEAFAKLLNLAQVGLVGPKPATSVAVSALDSLKSEIVDREAGRIKNNYMIKLGKWALAFCAIGVIAYLVAGIDSELVPAQVRHYRNFLLLWSGCMIGVWCSFASRKVIMGFFDLAGIEEDKVDPPLRLIFSGLLTSILGLIFVTGFANIVVGTFEGAKFLNNGSVALLIGALSGLAEKALPGAIMQRAQTIFQFEGAKKG